MDDLVTLIIDIGSVALKLFFFLCVAWVTFLAAKEEWAKQKRKVAVPLLLISVGLFYPISQSVNDLIRPVVSSGKVNLQKEDFKYDAARKQYRIDFSQYGKIEDVDVFYTAYYDEKGHHNGRMTWVKYVDYRFNGNWIQSNHILNDAVGQHTIVFKYRTWLWKYPAALRHAEQA